MYATREPPPTKGVRGCTQNTNFHHQLCLVDHVSPIMDQSLDDIVKKRGTSNKPRRGAGVSSGARRARRAMR